LRSVAKRQAQSFRNEVDGLSGSKFNVQGGDGPLKNVEPATLNRAKRTPSLLQDSALRLQPYRFNCGIRVHFETERCFAAP
jgi:hypothetical protein